MDQNKFFKTITLLTFLYCKMCYADVIVAIIDSGIHLSHKKIRDHLWQNAGEQGVDHNGRDKGSNGIDDDGNGYVDDVYGWDFVERNPSPIDHNGHGTHIAGIILGWSDSSQSAESDEKIKILPLKYYHPGANGQLNMLRSLEAFKYAIDAGVDIINYSGGGIMPDPREEALIRLAASKGIVVVTAAGNNGNDLAVQKFYPASYPSKNIFTVAALDRSGRSLLKASNFGQKVQFVALGEDVESALPHQRTGPMSGTSQATAFVSRAVAMTLSDTPDLKFDPEKLSAEIRGLTEVSSQVALKAPSAMQVGPVPKLKSNIALLFPQ